MKLVEALRLIKNQPNAVGTSACVGLACGFTPLHLETFLAAHWIEQDPNAPIQIETGLFGDLAGNIERLAAGNLNSLAVVIEWSDLDPRLGYRTSGGWRLGQSADILPTVSLRLDYLQAVIQAASEQRVVALALPTLPLPPAFNTPPAQGGTVAFSLGKKLSEFAAILANCGRIRIVNPQHLDTVSPFSERLDLRAELGCGFPYRIGHACHLAKALVGLIQRVAPKKGIITDLDNTLWRGILGEDGLDGVSWDLEHKSHAHALYQEMLASLAETGVFVAVASKNDPEWVRQCFQQREDLVVPKDVLFPIEADWGRKSDSVRRILATWNIGPDSVVFVDDSPRELEEVTSAIPEIEGLIFPTGDEQAVYNLLVTLRDRFGKTVVTEEDRIRLASIRNSQHRQQIATAGLASDDFLASSEAEIEVWFDQPDERVFQLINKTHQFNLNGRRIDEADFSAMQSEPDRFLVSAAYRDKFGPLGKIAVLAGRLSGNIAEIDLWVMSCRAFSRNIEHNLLAILFEHLAVREIHCEFVPTERNGPLREFLHRITGVEPANPTVIDRQSFSERSPKLYAKVTRHEQSQRAA